MKNILGLSYMYHDSSACLLQGGRVAAAASEERFSRIKHSVDFPIRAIEYCLSQGGVEARDLDAVVFYEKPFLKFGRILKTHLACFPFSYKSFRAFLPMWINYKLCVPQTIREKMAYEGPIYFTDHHYAHAASAFLPSPFERAMVLTMDGTGEWSTLCCGIAQGSDIKLEKDIRFPHSLGLLYSAITAHLGFKVNGGEGTVMGLAGYGKPSYRRTFEDLIRIRADGSFQLNLDFFSYHYDLVMTNAKFADAFFPPRLPGGELLERHCDLAATLQAVVEEVAVKLVRWMHSRYRVEDLCIAGGVGLNCVSNAVLLEKTPIKRIFIQPASGDDGCSMGAALYVYSTRFGGKERRTMRSAALGPEFSDDEMQAVLDKAGLTYEKLPEEELLRKTAELIGSGKIIGWFQGRMEFGPRALGHRSILADARNPGMKDILNHRVKHRESFRPFAPAVCAERADEYFEDSHESPFMLLSFRVRPQKRGEIPSAVHTDGSARLQTVTEADHPLFYRLIKEFGRQTGTPLILNTSFNGRGEPIVCTPSDAVAAFLKTGMDRLVMGRYLVSNRRRDSQC